MAKALISLSEVKSYLNISDNSDHDGFINNLIDVCSDYIGSFIGRDLSAKEFTEYYDGNAESHLFLNQYPVISITDVWDDTSRAFAVATKKAASEYICYNKKGMLMLLNGEVFDVGNLNVKVQYKAGYSVIPADIKQACVEMVARKYSQSKKGDGQLNTTSISTGGQTVTFDSEDLLPQIKRVLLSYRGYNI